MKGDRFILDIYLPLIFLTNYLTIHLSTHLFVYYSYYYSPHLSSGLLLQPTAHFAQDAPSDLHKSQPTTEQDLVTL